MKPSTLQLTFVQLLVVVPSILFYVALTAWFYSSIIPALLTGAFMAVLTYGFFFNMAIKVRRLPYKQACDCGEFNLQQVPASKREAYADKVQHAKSESVRVAKQLRVKKTRLVILACDCVEGSMFNRADSKTCVLGVHMLDLSHECISFVIAHEIAHAKHPKQLYYMFTGGMTEFFSDCIAVGVSLPWRVFGEQRCKAVQDQLASWLMKWMFAPARLCMASMDRSEEYRCDADAAACTTLDVAIDALEAIHEPRYVMVKREYMTPSGCLVIQLENERRQAGLDTTPYRIHPTLEERVAAIVALRV